MIRNTQFKYIKSTLEEQLKKDIPKVQQIIKLFVVTGKSSNIYNINKDDAQKHHENIGKTAESKINTINH